MVHPSCTNPDRHRRYKVSQANWCLHLTSRNSPRLGIGLGLGFRIVLGLAKWLCLAFALTLATTLSNPLSRMPQSHHCPSLGFSIRSLVYPARRRRRRSERRPGRHSQGQDGRCWRLSGVRAHQIMHPPMHLLTMHAVQGHRAILSRATPSRAIQHEAMS